MDDADRQDEPGARLGLVAGAGGLPGEALRALRRAGVSVEVLGFEGITDGDLSVPDEVLVLGQLAALEEALTRRKLRRLLIVGQFSKALLLRSNHLISPDAEAIRLLQTAVGWDDEGLIGIIAGWLEARNFEIARQDHLLAPMLAQSGSLAARLPSEAEQMDLEVGRGVVEQLGRVGVGQCAAIRKGCVIALEAVEGTDAMIRRAGEVAGAGATIVKSSRPNQDRRFDLPAVGMATLREMQSAGATALAVEAGSTLILGGSRFRELADDLGIAVWGFEGKSASHSFDDKEVV